MSGLDWSEQLLIIFGYFSLISLPFFLIALERKLDQIIRLLEIGNNINDSRRH